MEAGVQAGAESVGCLGRMTGGTLRESGAESVGIYRGTTGGTLPGMTVFVSVVCICHFCLSFGEEVGDMSGGGVGNNDVQTMTKSRRNEHGNIKSKRRQNIPLESTYRVVPSRCTQPFSELHPDLHATVFCSCCHVCIGLCIFVPPKMCIYSLYGIIIYIYI